jgi:hypothetical protein
MTEDSGTFKTNPAHFTPIWFHKMNKTTRCCRLRPDRTRRAVRYLTGIGKRLRYSRSSLIRRDALPRRERGQ